MEGKGNDGSTNTQKCRVTALDKHDISARVAYSSTPDALWLALSLREERIKKPNELRTYAGAWGVSDFYGLKNPKKHDYGIRCQPKAVVSLSDASDRHTDAVGA
ncbi:hypothetical protein EVAR_76000_1 [Eumeta japonica]|uniref:Uncharacterized protein n=1 Tax=Eumeta variegata TaxID=151549 RepID=A0A4C1UBH0_EUMVA|nr:hypothetical protein EVAR_76000_1 [Eumeta japonica]